MAMRALDVDTPSASIESTPPPPLTDPPACSRQAHALLAEENVRVVNRLPQQHHRGPVARAVAYGRSASSGASTLSSAAAASTAMADPRQQQRVGTEAPGGLQLPPAGSSARNSRCSSAAGSGQLRTASGQNRLQQGTHLPVTDFDRLANNVRIITHGRPMEEVMAELRRMQRRSDKYS